MSPAFWLPWRSISKGNYELVLYLLSKLEGVALCRAHERVLLTAIRLSEPEMVRMMLDNRGWNAVSLATARRQIGVMRLLLLHGADYLRRNENGASAYSRSRDDAEVAKAFDDTLVEMGGLPLT